VAIEGWQILLTGGAGFIGSHLCERLAEKNRIRVLDNLRRNALPPLLAHGHPHVELRQGDVMDEAAVRDAVAGCDAVVHLASIAGVDTVMKNPVLTMRTSLLGTANVLEATLHAGRARRFIDFSTSEVFGRYAYNVAEVDATTLGAVGEARWTYAVAKLATEHLAITYHKQHGLPACAVRPFNVFGPRQVGEGAIHHFIVRALQDQPIQVHNDGGQIRSWCYVDDIVDGILLALERDEAPGHTFNIGNPRATITIYNLAREVVRLSGSRSPIEFVRWEHQDVELRIPNVDKARRLLGFDPKVDLEDGIMRTLAWYRDRR